MTQKPLDGWMELSQGTGTVGARTLGFQTIKMRLQRESIICYLVKKNKKLTYYRKNISANDYGEKQSYIILTLGPYTTKDS